MGIMRMALTVVLALGFIAVPPMGEAQQARKVPRIGVLTSNPMTAA
jgi:hypothetical protein